MRVADSSTFTPAEGKGEVLINYVDNKGQSQKIHLSNVLYIPSFPNCFFSVNVATKRGAKFVFEKNNNFIKSPSGNCIPMVEHGCLYYIAVNQSATPTPASTTSVMTVRTLKEWHEILGHCNIDSLRKLEKNIPEKCISSDKQNFDCEVCFQTKLPNCMNHKVGENKCTRILERVNCDLAGPIKPEALGGYRYAINFVDAYSGLTAVYFLRSKHETLKAVEKYMADMSPLGRIGTIRSDNGLEFVNKELSELLISKGIRHETSSPYSPHQNGLAERSWRTLFSTARALIASAGSNKHLWAYAVKYACYTRNRCYSDTHGMTCHEKGTGRKPKVNNLLKFGSVCYAYDDRNVHKKLDDRGLRGTFLGFDTNSPACLIKLDGNNKIYKFRHVKAFRSPPTTPVSEPNTQSDDLNDEDEVIFKAPVIADIMPGGEVEDVAPALNVVQPVPAQPGDIEKPMDQGAVPLMDNEIQDGAQLEQGLANARKSSRVKQKSVRLKDYVTDSIEISHDCDRINSDDHDKFVYECYSVVCDIPRSYQEAVTSNESKDWKAAMETEIRSMKDLDVYEDVVLPKGQPLVGGRWVYARKETDSGNNYKVRYVAKGYSQTLGVDYHDTFAPTAKFVTLRFLVQMSVDHDLVIRQYDIKTAFLNAPLKECVHVKPPMGYACICWD